MRRSTDRILTTHTGALPGFADLDPAARDYDARLKQAVADIVRRQRETGIDIVNEGEYTKGGDWVGYLEHRFGGFEQRPGPVGKPILVQGKDREDFAEFYAYATKRKTLFYTPSDDPPPPRGYYVCTGPVTYSGQAAMRREIDVMKAVTGPEDAFITSTAPASLEVYRDNAYYKTEEEYVYALAEAMRVEYEMIVDAGFLLQVDDAWLPALWDRIGMEMGLEAFRRRSRVRIEALNHALSNIPEDKIRYHLCWGSWHGPHAHDIELRHLVDLMLMVKAEAYLIEAANARHEHEAALWETVKLPEGKILVPGVVTHSTDLIEHPELVSQRIRRFARLVGRENVIAGTDCGFGGRSHPQIAWAKLKSLADGAALASKALGYK